ncbi:MAG: hypothetical protein ACOZEN_16255 [Thermodesulfobacteriota bacterium]
MTISSVDLDKEARKRRVLELFALADARLEDMRLALERQEPLDALERRDGIIPLLGELAVLLDPPLAPAALGRRGADPQSLQDFRRAALDGLETLRNRFNALCAGPWHSNADASRRASVRRASARLALCCAVAMAALAGWWGWQERREAHALAMLDQAKAGTASQAVKLISMTAWLAVKTQGKPLGELARDMSGDCSGVNVDLTLPNHPCRQAWAGNGHAIFRASIPAPGEPVDCPSELFFDPWGGPYVLVIPSGGRARALSAGPDGLVGTPDDIVADIPYWEESGGG